MPGCCSAAIWVSTPPLALTLAATGPGKYKIGPSLPGWLTAVGALGGGALAGTLVAKMVTARPPQPKADAGLGPVPAAEPVHD